MFRLSKLLEKLEDKLDARFKSWLARNKAKLPMRIPAVIVGWYFYGMFLNSLRLGIASTFHTGEDEIKSIWVLNPFKNWGAVFTGFGIVTTLVIILIICLITKKGYIWFSGYKYTHDPRGFDILPDGTHGTSGFLTEKEMREFLELSPAGKAEGMILGKVKKHPDDPDAYALYAAHRMVAGDNNNLLCIGAPGSGKSMSCKREITYVMLTTKDNVIICDPEDEYSPLVNRLGGQVIRLSPNSRDYVNPLDINLNYSEEENPLALKSDFVLSFCELIMGSKTGLEAIEKTVIDRAVQMIYQPYFADPRPENMPVLGDLLDALMAQGIPEAERVAQALDLYVNGSLNFFNHRTTVDIRNRLVCFDIKGLGKNLKKPGMLIVQDAVWNTVTVNRSIGRATWYFVDEFHLLLKEEQTAAYSAEVWKRFRKWGGIPTGATQNPKDLLSSPEIENILENSDFIYLLNLSAGDRKLMTERLNISAEQLAYVTNADPGSGLLFFQNVILPFRDEFPKDTELYKLLTTKPGEVAHDGESG